jgi:hypothetical protein
MTDIEREKKEFEDVVKKLDSILRFKDPVEAFEKLLKKRPANP